MYKKSLLMIALFALPIWCQQMVTLPQAWQFILQHNLTLQQQQKAVEKAAAEVLIQKTAYLPILSGNAAYSYISEVATLTLPAPLSQTLQAGNKEQYNLSLHAQQPIFNGFRTFSQIRAGKEKQQAANAALTAVQHQLLLQTGKLYYQIQLYQLQTEVLKKSLQRTIQQLEVVKNSYAAYQVMAFDTLQMVSHTLRLKSQLKSMKNLTRISLSSFNYLINPPREIYIEYPDIKTLDLSYSALPAYQQNALIYRPELKKSRHLRAAQGYQIRSLRSVYYPRISATAAYHYARPGVNFFRNQWMNYYVLGMKLEWQFWNPRQNHLQVAQAQRDYQVFDIDYQKHLQNIKQQVNEAYWLLENTHQQIILQRQLVEREQERYRITREQLAQGQATPLNLTDAETALTTAQLQLQKKYIEWNQQKLQLRFATGEIGEAIQ